MEIIPIIKNHKNVGQIIEYRKENGQLHRIIGPAFKKYENNIWSYQWWENGILIAMYTGVTEELFQCLGGNEHIRKKLPLKTKWKDYEQSISLDDIKRLIKNVI